VYTKCKFLSYLLKTEEYAMKMIMNYLEEFLPLNYIITFSKSKDPSDTTFFLLAGELTSSWLLPVAEALSVAT
jgi:hypothetical protein